MPEPHDDSTGTVPSLDDFDALLAPAAPTPAGAPSAGHGPSGPGSSGPGSSGAAAFAAPAATTAHEAAPPGPSLGEFAANWELYRDPVLAGGCAGLMLGLAGVFVVLRRAVFVTAAVSQASALGVAVAFLIAMHTGLEPPPVVTAFVFASLGALLLTLRSPSRWPREASVGLLYLVTGALTVIVGDRISQEAHDVSSLLFGSAVLVRPLDLGLLVAVGSLGTAVLLALSRGLVFAGFDPEAARVQGLPVRRLEALFWLLVAAEIAAATRALGALPVFAFAILPALGALGLARRLPQCLALAALFGAASGALGYIAAYRFDLPVGAAQAAFAALLTVAATLAGAARRRAGG